MSTSAVKIRMGPLRVGALFLYLTGVTAYSAYFVWGLWGAVPSTTASIPDDASDVEDIAPPVDKPTIVRLDPLRLTFGVGRPTVRVLGHHLKDDSQVRLDGAPRPTDFISSNELVVRLRASDFDHAGTVVLNVKAGDQVSNSKTLLLESSSESVAFWQPFTQKHALSAETRLLLLILFTGAFGGSLMGLQSMSDYRGQGKLYKSWTVFYLVRPLIGAGVAFVFYVVIRGGFLAGTDVDLGVATPFGMIAVAALTGMFSDKAILKLNEVFQTLFKSDDSRAQKIGSPAPLNIETKSLLDGTNGQPYGPVPLAASGGTEPHTWTAVTPLPAGLALDSTTGVINGTPTATTAKQKYEFEVKDKDGASAKVELDLEIK